MAYEAIAIEVMIASPADVIAERQVVREVIAEWNAIHSRRESLCIMAIGWETHSSPELAGRPQQIINERLLESADLLIGIFWTRVGSPTGKSISGSVEEIERHLEAGKPVMLYFSTAPVVPSSLDRDQFEALEQFKTWAKTQGLIEVYDSIEDFRTKFRTQLQIALSENQHLDAIRKKAKSALVHSIEMAPENSLTDDAREMLLAASEASNGLILIRRHLGGTSISAGHQKFAEDGDRRSIARWLAAAEELHTQGCCRDINGKREIFELTHNGYQYAENLKARVEGE